VVRHRSHSTDSPEDRRGGAWSETWIREQLTEFLANRSVWPTYREFERWGLRSLRDQVTRSGGARRWADAMGVRFVRHRPGYAVVWTEDRIRDELVEYLVGRKDWPSRSEFERDGRTALRNAVNRTGGPDRWADDLGMQRHDRRAGIRRGWTPEEVETHLRDLIGTSGVWPTRAEFERAGLAGLRGAIYRYEGPDYWARRMSVTRRPPTATRSRSPRWTSDLIRTELERFCAGCDTFPPERAFIAAGLRPLYAAASRKGGIAWWAEQLGLRRHPHQPSPPAR
jgi:Arc/MetJ-type ribon-helix-helix transcriptional regulator